MRLTRTLVAVAAVSVTSACGIGSGASSSGAANASGGGNGPSPGAPAAGAPAAVATAASDTADCSYISPAQLSSIEGETYAAPTAFHSICSWLSAHNGVGITLTHNATEAAWQDVLDTVQRDQATDPPTPIPGLGDRAAGAGQEIAVQHGGTIIDIRGADSPGYGKWPKSTAIANAIIASGKAN